MYYFLFFIVVISLFLYYFNVTNKIVSLKNKPKKAAEVSSYRCVVVKTSAQSCQAIKELSEKVFLLDEAPILPLNNCDSSKCNCMFIRRNDRRQGPRRSFEYPALNDHLNVNNEKRTSRGRRKSDKLLE